MAEFFGTQAQQALLARGAWMHEATRDDPSLHYYGRTVGIAELGPGDMKRLTALVRLQGNSSAAIVSADNRAGAILEGERAGLVLSEWARWTGGAEAMERAEAILAETPLPDDLTVEELTDATADATWAAFGEMALAQGVLPPARGVLTGRLQPGIGLVAVDGAGRVVSCGGAASYLRPDHRLGRTECWWGLLATDPARRGARLSLILGARALLAMRDRYGYPAAMTGIAPGNAPSEAVCARMGFSPSGESVLGFADPAMLPGGRMTK